MIKVYLSTIRTEWPFERQEDLLDERMSGWRDAPVFRDQLSTTERQTHSPANLRQRFAMLGSMNRDSGEDVVVASLAVLDWSVTGFRNVLIALSARDATLRSAECGTVVPPDDAAATTQAIAAFEHAIRRAIETGQRDGLVSGDRRPSSAQQRCALIRERWGMPNSAWTTTALCAEAGVSKPTALKWLGPRDVAQRRHEARQAAAERA